MKRLFTLLMVIVSFSAHGQWGCQNLITFENTDTLYPVAITIDTVNYHNNKWQIGHPHKTIFDSSHTLYNAIITDTSAAYPQNDTSVFIIKAPHKLPPGIFHPFLYELEFFYQLSIDVGSFARFEVSEDSGMNWVNPVDSFSPHYGWEIPIPNFSTSTSGWQKAKLYLYYGWSSSSYDTTLFRFTFVSDTTTPSQEGWMIDDIKIIYWCEGAAGNIKNDNLITAYPNPTTGMIQIGGIKHSTKDATVKVYNMLGQEVFQTNTIPPDGKINLALPDGMYVLKYVAGDEFCTKRIIIEK